MSPLDLTPREETQAARTVASSFWCIYTEEEGGEEVTRGILLSIHDLPAKAQAALERRAAQAPASDPADARYYVENGWNLLALVCSGLIDAAALRAFLRTGEATDLPPTPRGSPGVYSSQLRAVPLSAEECRRAGGIEVWTVYYEDWFHFGSARDSFPMWVCFTKEEADAKVAPRPVASGQDGYLTVGPHPLVRGLERTPDIGPAVVREVLRRHDAGEAGPVPVAG